MQSARGTSIEIHFESRRCIHARHCVLGAPRVFLANTPGEWIEAAIRQAALNKAASLKYIDTILRAWRTKYLPGDKPWQLEARRKGRGSAANRSNSSFIDQLADIAQESSL